MRSLPFDVVEKIPLNWSLHTVFPVVVCVIDPNVMAAFSCLFSGVAMHFY